MSNEGQPTQALLPCPNPWCSTHDPEHHPYHRGFDYRTVCVQCSACLIHGPRCATEAEAETAWNTRANPTPAAQPRADEGENTAWTWLESKFLNVEAGHDPNDRDYSADDMVDAFIAGLASRPPEPTNEALVEALWRKACVGREGYCSSDLQAAAKSAIAEALSLAERTARSVDLPPQYQWSEGNREKFHFGRDTAADASAAMIAAASAPHTGEG